MSRCIQLAGNGLGQTYPNPMVGCVIVHQDRIIAEGWHHRAGEPHAEIEALNKIKHPEHLKESTLFVSLEPCSHFGKTPPCSDRIIASGIKKVVIGTMDPFAAVSGRGIRKLIEAGCQVKVGILEDACRMLNRRFFTFHQQKRPYIILKWAQSQDGYIAPTPTRRVAREPVWISNPFSKQLVHKWRSEEQAILVGTRTVLEDNPKLDTREWTGNNPVRIVLDPNSRIPEESSVFNGKVTTIRIVGPSHGELEIERIPAYITERIDYSAQVPEQIASLLYDHEVQSVIVEGGAQTLNSFISSGLWDEARIFTGNLDLTAGVPAPTITGNTGRNRKLQQDSLKIIFNPETKFPSSITGTVP